MLIHGPPSQTPDHYPQQYCVDDTDIDIDEESDTVLDDNILDDSASAAIDMVTPYGQRPDYAGCHTFIPADHSAWQDVPTNSESMPFTAMNQQTHLLPSDPASHFHQSSEQAAEYGGHTVAWHQHPNLASPPHNAVFSTYPHDPAIKGEGPYNHVERAAPHGLPMSTTPDHPPYATSATSPQSDNGWVSTSSTEHAEKVPKREPATPVFVDNPPRLRPDGVRKKNARFEIPEERKVDTIDKIISQTDPHDEQLLKELKQQKRLLRNRQAA